MSSFAVSSLERKKIICAKMLNNVLCLILNINNVLFFLCTTGGWSHLRYGRIKLNINMVLFDQKQ